MKLSPLNLAFPVFIYLLAGSAQGAAHAHGHGKLRSASHIHRREHRSPSVNTQDAAVDALEGTRLAARAAANDNDDCTGSDCGLVGYVDPVCGPSGATFEISKGNGPNGKESWLNCGTSESEPDSPWTPPTIKLSQLKVISLSDYLAKPNSTFQACEPYLSIFNRAAEEQNVPPILLASIGMQESGCNESAVGDAGGAFGIMQLIEAECEGRNATECSEPNFNIETGAKHFAENLARFDNNFLEALGGYNGWYRGMTYRNATYYHDDPEHCSWQQNLDYLEQTLNGWYQDISPYKAGLGAIGNLVGCNN